MSDEISCANCNAACCRYFMIRLASPLSSDEARWYELHGVKVRNNGLLFETPCQMLDLETNKCKIYEKRPKCCQDAPVGGKNCLFSRLHMKGKEAKR